MERRPCGLGAYHPEEGLHRRAIAVDIMAPLSLLCRLATTWRSSYNATAIGSRLRSSRWFVDVPPFLDLKSEYGLLAESGNSCASVSQASIRLTFRYRQEGLCESLHVFP